MRTVVIGASLAGLSVARTLRAAGERGPITLVGDESRLPYDRPPLSKEVLAGTGHAERSLEAEQWYAEHDVEVLRREPARDLDPVQRVVHTDRRTLRYDNAVITTGARPRRLPGAADRPDLHVVRTWRDAERLRAALNGARHVVVIGAGFLGLEVGAVARELGLDVCIVDPAPTPLLRALGPEVGRWFAGLHRAHGIDLRCATPVRSVAGGHRRPEVQLEDGDTVIADLVVVAVGAEPNTEWLAGSGVPVADGVICDEFGRTSVPGVSAAGDVARWFVPRLGTYRRIEHWSNAVDQGRVVAAGLLGDPAPTAGIPSFWSDQYTARARFVGYPGVWDEVDVQTPSEGRLLARYCKAGELVGALCVGLPRALPALHREIAATPPRRHALIA